MELDVGCFWLVQQQQQHEFNLIWMLVNVEWECEFVRIWWHNDRSFIQTHTLTYNHWAPLVVLIEIVAVVVVIVDCDRLDWHCDNWVPVCVTQHHHHHHHHYHWTTTTIEKEKVQH